MIKVYVVGRGIGYARWIENKELVNNIEEADVVLFTGGEDVNPALYGAQPHPSTYFTPQRDAAEVDAFNKMRPGQVALGICRGLQLLNVLNGGKLVQDVTGHCLGFTHEMHNADGLIYDITSLHHQMVYPFTINKKYWNILFWSDPRSAHYEGDGIDGHYFAEYGEPEVVEYKTPGKPVCLGIQGHPEMMRESSPTVKMFNEMLKNYLNK